jgi:hypothetical protein
VLILWYGGWLAIEQDGRMTAGMLITYQVQMHYVCVCVYASVMTDSYMHGLAIKPDEWIAASMLVSQ